MAYKARHDLKTPLILSKQAQKRLTSKGKPGYPEAVRAFCYECMGGFEDGRQDCNTTQCSLYSWQPYKKQDADLSWMDLGWHFQDNRVQWKKVEREKRIAKLRAEGVEVPSVLGVKSKVIKKVFPKGR